jgi:anthranilate 1,2-dioxygenase large subunit
MVVREPRGNRTSHTCVYHHWCYDLEGNLIGVPFQKGSQGQGGMPESFNKEDHGLQKYQVETYKGVIFGATRPDVEPLEDYLDEPSRSMLDRLFRKDIEILGYMRQRMPANWKVYWENLNDGYHAGLLHQLPVVFGIHRITQEGGITLDKRQRHGWSYVLYDSDDEEAIHEGYDETGIYDEGFTLNDRSLVDFIDEENDREVLNMLNVFPSVFFQQLSNTLATRQIRPKNPGEFELYWTYFGYKDDTPELRKARMQQVNMVGPAGMISLEDGESGVLIQRAVQRQGEFHSTIEMGGVGPVENQTNLVTEVPIRGFWRHYCEMMGFNTKRVRSAAE